MQRTRLSTRGQIVLPKELGTARACGPGTEFTVEETREGILLRPAGRFPRTKVEDVAGCLKPKRKVKVIDMDAAIALEVARRHARGRY